MHKLELPLSGRFKIGADIVSAESGKISSIAKIAFCRRRHMILTYEPLGRNASSGGLRWAQVGLGGLRWAQMGSCKI